MSYDRRTVLGLSLGAAGALALPGLAAASGAAPTRAATGDTPDPISLVRKLKLRSDDGLIFWWLEGPKIGQVGATLTALYTSRVGTVQRVRQLEDGGLEVTQLEMILMFDHETGAPLERWRNPYTGESVPIRFRPVGPLKVQYRADNSRILPTELGGTPLESAARTHAPRIVADDVFLHDEVFARVFTPGRERPFEVNDHAVYHGSLRELSDPAVTMAEAAVFFVDVTDWQRWMQMGDLPGSITSRMVGRKCRRWEDLPEDWRRRLAELAPDLAADPVGALDEAAAAFER
jgi:hypothetical protein